MNTTKNYYLLILNVFSYLAMIVINCLAQFGILNGSSTAEISDRYVNLFTPSGFTFSIWSVIYILLGIYVIMQFKNYDSTYIKMIAPFLFISSILNILWILSWHYLSPIYSFITIILLLLTLMVIYKNSRDGSSLTKITFSIYYGWITVASIASVFVLFSKTLKIPYDSLFYIVLAAVSVGITILLMMIKGRTYKDIPYILTLVWSIFGILYKHMSETGFNGKHIAVVTICIVAVIVGLAEALSVFLKRNQ